MVLKIVFELSKHFQFFRWMLNVECITIVINEENLQD